MALGAATFYAGSEIYKVVLLTPEGPKNAVAYEVNQLTGATQNAKEDAGGGA
eukprot:CAMPEP_0173390498 /NCGR_PEP_ID=MMETSP1356-20130122/15103_1 /TAXON_ID=77927 ORGANISM="Hemiselmis virescens, Strain PCC157" /NCGR_SAMPLE_ID=MMETSP1356 /ASSEMBLY_ACC=CAM_ASM_000847 /LENGTH=51 /DNA_ID=CAMNT_0014347909 /DNA_START=95 /DNA_END=251 /DNA_ORIENTATION=+